MIAVSETTKIKESNVQYALNSILSNAVQYYLNSRKRKKNGKQEFKIMKMIVWIRMQTFTKI